MKLLRWSLAGASAFVIYKYSIGKKAKGDDVLQSPERTLANAKTDANVRAAKAAEKPKRKRAAPATGAAPAKRAAK
jgi:hypothetical protein